MEVLDKLNKSFGPGTIMALGDKPEVDVEVISTGSLEIDRVSGIGGIPLGKIIEIYGENSSGKSQPLSSNILTPTGWRKMGELEAGDLVCTPSGELAAVDGVFPQGALDVYRVQLDDGSSCECSADHLWTVRQQRTSDLWEVLTTQQIIESGVLVNNGDSLRCRFQLPDVMPQHFHPENVDVVKIPPYTLGYLLGDGGLGQDGSAKISIGDEDWDEARSHLKADVSKFYSDSVVLSERHGAGLSFGFKKAPGMGNGKNEISKALIGYDLNGKLSFQKHIPKEYLLGSPHLRREVLRGLMDSDGCKAVNGTSSYSYTTTSPQLRDDFIFLCRSLGMKCSASSRKTKYTSKTGERIDGRISYRMALMFQSDPFPLFKLSRKVAGQSFDASTHRHRAILSIQKEDPAECQCISITHPDKLYITDDFIPTHNTTILMQLAAQFQKAGHKVAWIDVEQAFNIQYAKDLDMDIDSLVFSQPSSAEDAMNIIGALTDSGEFSLICLDSTGALAPAAEINGDYGDSHIGLVPRLMAQSMRKLTHSLGSNDCTLALISQTRANINTMGYGPQKSSTGGNAIKFYCSMRIDVKNIGQIKVGDDRIGHKLKVTFIKNRFAAPYQDALTELIYGHGVCKYMELINIATKAGIITQGGSWLTYGEDEAQRKAQGKFRFKELLVEEPELFDEIKSQIVGA